MLRFSWEKTVVPWPALIKYVGDDELTFVSSSEDLNNHPDLLDVQFNPCDVLIDTAGKVYRLRKGLSRIEIPQQSVEILSLDSIVDLVRRHASSRGECCISKIAAPNISEAVALVKQMESR